jgi:hypothetical protein
MSEDTGISFADVLNDNLPSPEPVNQPQPEEQPKAPEAEPTPDELTLLKRELETTNKRLNDTKKWGNKQSETVAHLKRKAQEKGQLTSDDFENLDFVPQDERQRTLKEVADKVGQELPIIEATLIETGQETQESLNSYKQSFQTLAQLQPELLEEFLATDPNKRPAFVLKKGKELASVHQFVSQHNSIGDALRAALSSADSVKKTAYEEGYQAALKEAEKRASDYVGSKPSLRAKAPVTGTAVQEERRPTFADIL